MNFIVVTFGVRSTRTTGTVVGWLYMTSPVIIQPWNASFAQFLKHWNCESGKRTSSRDIIADIFKICLLFLS